MNYKFPDNFLWGSAVWATGVESAAFIDGKALTVWDRHYQINPKRFYNEIGPDQTNDFYHNYQEYIDVIANLKHNSFRTSILWARLLPDGKHVNEKAFEFYRNMFKAIKQKNIFLSVVLYWFDMPLQYEEKGGFSNREIIDDFVFYCETCFKLFDGLVDAWFIFNEPIMDVFFKYQMGVCYPIECDLNKTMQSCYNMAIAHANVVKMFKENNFHGRLGSVLNQSIVYPRSDDKDDLKAKDAYELFNYKVFESPLLKGYIEPKWFEFAKNNNVVLDIRSEDEELIKNNTISFIGINVYLPIRVKKKESEYTESTTRIDFAKSPFFDSYVWPLRKFNKDRGWEIYPEVIYDLLKRNQKEYPNLEMLITENGIGIQNEDRYRNESGQIQDDYRIDFIKDHLMYAHKALQEGVKLIGYNVWSFIDLWSPTNQYKNTYGLIEFDLQTKKIRRKKSADWFEKVSINNGF